MKEFKERDQLDRTLNSGERQVHESMAGVEQWHLWRYYQARDLVRHGECVVDLGCGIGYGSMILARDAREVVGVDDSEETIEYAKKNYSAPNVSYLCRDIFDIPKAVSFDMAVALEVLEHTPDPERFFSLLSRIAQKRFIISAPHDSLDASLYPFHYRHFTEKEIELLILGAGFKVRRLEYAPLSGGKTIIAVGER